MATSTKGHDLKFNIFIRLNDVDRIVSYKMTWKFWDKRWQSPDDLSWEIANSMNGQILSVTGTL